MWVGVAIVAYALLALVVVVDKYLLAGPLPNPKLYAFAIGLFGTLGFALIPFGFLEIPSWPIVILGIGAGVLQVFAILALFQGLKRFEASRIIPAIGGLLPIFTLLLTVLVGRAVFGGNDLAAFAFLVAGSVGVTIEKRQFVTLQSMVFAFGAALLFALFVVLSKFVYEGTEHFLSGLLWIITGGFLAALLLFAVSSELRGEVRNALQKRGSAKKALSMKVLALFAGNQAAGAAGFVLQNWAVALAPFAYIAFVNALEGIKYVFVLALASALSFAYPRVIQEQISKPTIAQKAAAIAFIGIGLFLLAI